MNKIIYYFGKTLTEGNSEMLDILGGKGANLAQMCKLGLPIPPGFTISTDLCKIYSNNSDPFTPELLYEIKNYIRKIEDETGKIFGGSDNPLLLSVRSGAKISMPGMMDTILNLGMNDQVAQSLAKQTNNPCFAYDSYRRFLEMFATVVLGIANYLFEEILENHKFAANIEKDSDLPEEILKEIIAEYKQVIKKYTGKEFESDPMQQLICAIEAVLKSWTSSRAVTYRKIHNISDDMGTAVNIQSMVFGNKGKTSATGVVFTRSPSDGNKVIFGEFLINAQGEDVVAGIRTPLPLIADDEDSMQQLMPQQFMELKSICDQLEAYFKDMQDIEFTIEDGKLYLLQTRSGKRSAASAVKVAVDMVNEGIISKQEALMRIDPESLNQLLHTTINYSYKPNIIACGLPASPGANTGIAVFSPYDAEELSHHHKVILVRNDTSPEDIKGMHLSVGIITARGGMTSHAAVVARGIGKPCVCGVKGLMVNEAEKFFTTSDGTRIKQGDTITIDGSTGNIIIGNVKLVEPNFSNEFTTILEWADEEKKLVVRANAETALDASVALKFGAKGIGLCRTEHMFFDEDKIPIVREMIIAQNYEHRMNAINKLKPLQVNDFKSLFMIMKNLPVNIRLLDPPLHEFLPREEKDKEELAKILNISKALIDHRLHVLHEINPMLGHRGCRLGITYPEIYQMQVEAMLEAIFQVQIEENITCTLELMIPLISDVEELKNIKSYVLETISCQEEKYSTKFNVKIGTMIELPRAAITADKIAPNIEYFSFGSNDLTQTTYGISRDDIGSFLPDYLERKIFLNDPFAVIDIEGVGSLIKMAAENGRRVNSGLTLGICGEHAGDPESIKFFDQIGLDYISCSPYRIPIARVAAARSKIMNQKR
ncbi:MAG: pyruvate, phosphate dikinase [Rickettsiales bacterium]|nr:MAG: pyruvate, phosphate dikinase [Rickettsiales bacterium]